MLLTSTKRQNISAVQRRLRESGSGNFSSPENLHLTPAFLDEVAPTRLANIHRAMDSVALLGVPFSTQANAISLMCSERVGGKLAYIEQYRKE